MRGKINAKEHFYILVLTHEGPMYVTSFGEGKVAHWDRMEKPLEVSENYGQQVVLGLNWNGSPAVLVNSMWEVETQPFLYGRGCFQWKYKDEDKEGGEEDDA
ncbi:MAG: hypothetical protein IKS07_02255 [Lachnospiraceae bacterium]|nr:hypothetical protein [Lachnospiraceae bacterium]